MPENLSVGANAADNKTHDSLMDANKLSQTNHANINEIMVSKMPMVDSSYLNELTAATDHHHQNDSLQPQHQQLHQQHLTENAQMNDMVNMQTAEYQLKMDLKMSPKDLKQQALNLNNTSNTFESYNPESQQFVHENEEDDYENNADYDDNFNPNDGEEEEEEEEEDEDEDDNEAENETDKQLKTQTKTSKHICTQCNRIFNSGNALKYHKRSHSGIRDHKCETCGKSFLAQSALKNHMRTHTGDKPYECEHCQRKFRQWGDLKYHITSLHSGEKNHQCEYCGKSFARKYSLVLHRSIHSGERRFKCDLCEKTFRASSYLKNHRKIHTGEKAHQCSVCGKAFRVAGDMKRHMRIHQPKAPNAAKTEKLLKTKQSKTSEISNHEIS